jgi:hypothetical protein
MSETEPRDWLYPRLEALVADAERAGITRDMTVALVTDIINGPPFNVGPDLTADEGWNKDIGETDAMVNLDTTGGLAPLDEAVVGAGLATFGRSRTGGRGQGRL